MERATIKRAKSRIDGSVRLASVLLSPLNHAITAERCLASPLGFQTSPIAPVGGPKCQEWVTGGGAVNRRAPPVSLQLRKNPHPAEGRRDSSYGVGAIPQAQRSLSARAGVTAADRRRAAAPVYMAMAPPSTWISEPVM